MNDTFKRLYCVWRIDGDFAVTDIDTSFQDMSLDKIIVELIKVDAEKISYENKEDKEEYIHNSIEMALNPECANFVGYEIVTMFIANSRDIKFIL